MPKLKLVEENAYGWGYYSYMFGALRKNTAGNLVVDRQKLNHSYVCMSRDVKAQKQEAIREAIKGAVSELWAEIVYFAVPMKTAVFGEMRNKAYIGFVTKGKEFHYFEKPFLLFDALEEIERLRDNE